RDIRQRRTTHSEYFGHVCHAVDLGRGARFFLPRGPRGVTRKGLLVVTLTYRADVLRRSGPKSHLYLISRVTIVPSWGAGRSSKYVVRAERHVIHSEPIRRLQFLGPRRWTACILELLSRKCDIHLVAMKVSRSATAGSPRVFNAL